MRRGAKPTKAGVSGKPRKNEGSKVRDLEKRLAEALKREAEAQDQQTATSEILRVVSSSPTELQPVLDAVAESAVRLCAAYDAVIFRLDGDVLRRAAHSGPIPAPVGFVIPATRSRVTGRAVLNRQPVQVADAQAKSEEFPETKSFAQEHGFRTILSVPLLREGIAIGTIDLRRTEARPFSPANIALLQTFADQAVIAIENVRLFTELQEKNRALTEAHEQVTEALNQQTATSEILRVISSSPTEVQPVFDAMVAAATTLCEADHAHLFRFDGDLIHFVAHHGSTPEEVDAARRAFPQLPSHGSVTARAILATAVVQIADVSEDPELADALRVFRTVLSVPMVRDGRPLGAITVARRVVRSFTDKQIALLQTFADQAVIAIENVRLFKELEARNRDLTEALEHQTATGEILQVISHSPTEIQPVFETIVRSAVRLCDGFFGIAYRYDDHQLSIVAHHNFSSRAIEIIARSYPAAASPESMAGRAVLRREVIHVSDVTTPGADTGPRTQRLGLDLGYRAFLSVPMLRYGEPIGVINVTRREPRPFTDKQIALVKTFADQAVIAVENVRLFKELETRNRALTEALEQQTATSEILRVISSSPTDVQPVFDTIVTSAGRLCGAESAVVYRFEAEMADAVALYNVNPDAIDAYHRRFPRRLRDTDHLWRVADGSVLNIADIADDPHTATAQEVFRSTVNESLRMRDVRSLVLVPMVRDEQAIGAIGVSHHDVGAFSGERVRLLKTFAAQAVIAIENVRLFSELQARNRDVTEALEQQTATGEILRVIASSPTDLQPVLDALVESAGRLCQAADTFLLLVEGDQLRVAALHGSVDENARLSNTINRGWVAGRAIVDARTVHVEDLANAEAEFPIGAAIAIRLGHRTALAIPLLRKGVPIGALFLRRQEVHQFSNKEIALLQTFADQAVIAIENVRLFKELAARNTELMQALDQQTATAEILGVISSSPTDIQPVFAALATSAARLCDAFDAAIHRMDGDVLRLVAHEGPIQPDAVLPLEHGTLAGHVVRERLAMQVADMQAEAHVYPVSSEFARHRGFRTILSVPLLRGAEVLGIITIRRTEVRPFTDKQAELLKTFANQAVIAIENVRLFKELEARTAALTHSVEQLTALGEVGRAVSSTLDLETVLTTIVSRAVQLSGLDGGVVFEYDEAAQEFVQRAATETGGVLAEARRATRIRKGEGVLGRTAITLEPVQVPDITVPGAHESRLRENLIESGIRAVLAVPMVYEGRLIGSFGVTRNHPGEFPAETIELLRTFATQSALAIQNARLFREIADKSRQLEVASQHKSEFLANMSHELRTPLNAIIGFSEVLTERMFGELNEKQAEYLKDIYASGTHLLSLINDILDLSKIEAGRMELELTDFDLPTALDSALTLIRERAGRRAIALQMNVDERLGQVRADERKIRQVVLNLLSNAIKFTPEGGRIEVAAVPRDGSVEVSVNDTGVGIAPEDQDAVFEEFLQVGTAEKKAEGTGLGLTLCRKFIELHGGKIRVQSQVGQGSTFTFTIPVHRDG